jgi:hypothetical protein
LDGGAEIVGFGPIVPGFGWLLTPGELYLTPDEGRTWDDITPVLNAGTLLAADFLSDGSGWLLAGEPTGDEQMTLTLARTSDFGGQWSAAPLTLFAEGDHDATIAKVRLDFRSSREGVLQVRHVSSSNFERWSEWRTTGGGDTWQRVAAGGAVAGSDVDHSFLDASNGWRVERTGRCTESGTARTCQQVTRLVATSDGGLTWRTLVLPAGVGGTRQFSVSAGGASAAALAAGSRTMIAGGQGFDKCEIPTLDQLREWWAFSPYSTVNLYIGGSARACRNTALSAGYLQAIHAMGWSFIPTWVGPQAPCSSYRTKLSLDPATARSEGWAEANAAADVLIQLGLADESGAGSVVYYDMEYYSTADATCNAAVQSFAVGWKEGLHARGHTAGIYSTGSILSLLVGSNSSPDAVWAAHWISSVYNPEATVWNVYRIGNDVWSANQRLRQYTGGHDETWGSTQLRIDSNVLDGPVAFFGPGPQVWTPKPTHTPTATPTATSTPTPTATPTATKTVVPLTPTTWHYLPLLMQP